MKIYIKYILLLTSGVVMGLAIPRIKLLTNLVTNGPSPTPLMTREQKFQEEMKKYMVNIPVKFFDSSKDTTYGTNTTILKGFFINGLPEAVPRDNSIQVVNEKFDKKAICGTDFICDVAYEPPIDVDNDGKKEQIVTIFRGVNHGVRDDYILKNGNIIFKSLEAPQKIEESASHNGFYLTYYMDTFLTVPGTRTTVRYIYDAGKFIPVWKQTSTELQSSQL